MDICKKVPFKSLIKQELFSIFMEIEGFDSS